MTFRIARTGLFGVKTKDLTVSYVASATGGTGTTTRTFTGVSIGSAPAIDKDRYIVACMGWKDGSTTSGQSLSSGTIAGNAATVAGSRQDTGVSSRALAGIIIYGPINTGTTATITFTWTTNPGTLHYITTHSILVKRGSRSFSMTPSDTASDVEPDPSTTINCPAGGVIVGVCQTVNGSPNAWAGIDEDVENDVDSSDIMTAASKAFSAAQTGLTVSCTPSGAENESAMFLASWGP